MQTAGLKLTMEGAINDFLGVNINRQDDGTIHLTQPHLIDQILKEMRLHSNNVSVKTTPTAVLKMLKWHSESQSFDRHFIYWSIIGKLRFLDKSTRPDTSHATHQCARFSANLKQEHGKAVEWLCRYLAGTRDKGLIYQPDKDQSFDVYVDSDFAGKWDPEESSDDANTARLRTAYVIMYHGCPILWG